MEFMIGAIIGVAGVFVGFVVTAQIQESAAMEARAEIVAECDNYGAFKYRGTVYTCTPPTDPAQPLQEQQDE